MRQWSVIALLFVTHVGLTLLFFTWSSRAAIDTYTFTQESCKRLMYGVDPYGMTQTNIYPEWWARTLYGNQLVDRHVNVGYPYPPLTLLWVIPGYLLGDLRYSYVLAILIAACFTFAICPNKWGLCITAILLLNPLTFFVENQSWCEPLVLMALSATVYAAVNKRPWLPIALGVLLASKQYSIFAVPFISYLVQPFRWKDALKLAGLSSAIAVATILPFALWNFGGLWHDMFIYLASLPFRPDSISFAVRFPLALKIGPILLIVFVLWAFQTKFRNMSMFAAAFGVALLLFVAPNKQAFVNYYYLVSHSMLLSVACLLSITSPRMPEAIPNSKFI